MASSNVSAVTSHFSTANEGFVTTLNSSILAGAATVALNGTSGLTNGSIFVGIIEPGLTNQQTFTGTVDTGGSQVTGVKWTRGTNVPHTAGVTIVDYVSGTGHNMTTKGILVHANQDGTLKQTSVESALATSSGTVSSKALTNPYKFSAYRNSAANMATGLNKVLFDAEEYDTNNNFDAVTNNRYTAAIAGFYHFDAAVNFSATSAKGYYAVIYKNGSAFRRGAQSVAAASSNISVTVSADLSLAATDFVEVYFFNGDTGADALNVGTAPTVTSFSGHLISAL